MPSNEDEFFNDENTLFPQAAPTAELDRSDDKVYLYVMDLVKVVVQLKNDIIDAPPEKYITIVKVHQRK